MGGGVSYLDAGHGGYDPGASYFGISEKSLTLAIQSRVKAKLEAEGYQVVTTRTSDTYVDLADRSRAANASESDIFEVFTSMLQEVLQHRVLRLIITNLMQNIHHVLMQPTMLIQLD